MASIIFTCIIFQLCYNSAVYLGGLPHLSTTTYKMLLRNMFCFTDHQCYTLLCLVKFPLDLNCITPLTLVVDIFYVISRQPTKTLK